MPGHTWPGFAAIFLSVMGALAPVPASAIPVSTYISEQDQSVRIREMREAINNVLGPAQKKLNSATDDKGNPKSEQQMRQDSELADRILAIMNHIDQDKLALMVVEASRREPNVQLEDVIKAYIFQQLKQPQTPGKPASPK
jgi:L-asparaginase II